MERARSLNGSSTVPKRSSSFPLNVKLCAKQSFRSRRKFPVAGNFSSTRKSRHTRQLQTIRARLHRMEQQVSTKQYSPRSSRRARGRSIRWVSWRCHPSACQSCRTENDVVQNPFSTIMLGETFFRNSGKKFLRWKWHFFSFLFRRNYNSWRRSWLFFVGSVFFDLPVIFLMGHLPRKVPLQFHIFDRDKKNKSTIQFLNTKSHLKHKDNAATI